VLAFYDVTVVFEPFFFIVTCSLLNTLKLSARASLIELHLHLGCIISAVTHNFQKIYYRHVLRTDLCCVLFQ
jgi:hypothetical protein